MNNMILYEEDHLNITYNSPFLIMTFRDTSQALIRSFVKTGLLKGGTVSAGYKRYKWRCNGKVTMLSNVPPSTVPLHDSIHLAADLGTQLDYLLREEEHGILGYHERHVLCTPTGCVYVGSEVYRLTNKTRILVSKPFSAKEFYLSPEMQRIHTLPEEVPFQTGYYSLAMIPHLSPLEELSKCKQEDPEERRIILL